MKTICMTLLVLTLAVGNAAFADDSQNDHPGAQRASGKQIQKDQDFQPPQKVPVEVSRNEKGQLPLSGILLEKGTRRALPDITLYIREVKSKKVSRTLTTDKQGKFDCLLAAGKYTVIVAAIGYDKLEQKLEVNQDADLNLTLRLVPLTINPYQIIVRSNKKTSEVSDRKLTVEEAVQIPGANRDVLSSIKNLPGVNSTSVFNGYGNGIVIRGSSREDSSMLVNGHRFGGLYHFGGFESVIEPELVESIAYNAGGFSAEYGDAMGGIIDLEIKDPRTDRLGGFANLSLLSTSLMLEGPISDKDSFAFSFKRGFLDWYMQAALDMMDDDISDTISFKQFPSYYDASFIYRHSFSKGNDLKLTSVGKWNAMDVEVDSDSVDERDSNQAELKERDYIFIGEWDYNQDNFRSLFTPAFFHFYSKQYMGDRAYLNQAWDIYDLVEKIEYQINATHRLKGGVSAMFIDGNIDTYAYGIEKEGEVDSDIYDQEIRLDKDFFVCYPSLYIMDEIQLGRFSITPGIHGMYDSYNEKGAVDPRLSLKYQLTKATILKGAAGLYSQRPQTDEYVEPFGTEGLKPEKSIHGVAGVEHRLSENVYLDVQTYYKDFYDLIAREPGAEEANCFTNDGTGYSYGAEILLRHQMTDHFFGWISYAYSVARRKDAPGQKERYFDDDIPHNFIAVASYKPNRYWSFGMKYQYRSGTTYTDLLNTETLYNVDKDRYYPLYTGPINEDRHSPYQSLDFRIDKYWIFNNFILSTYLDWRNVLQNKNVYDKVYSEDYTQSDDFLDISSQVPLIFLGLKVDF